jgi:hypothetical protein
MGEVGMVRVRVRIRVRFKGKGYSNTNTYQTRQTRPKGPLNYPTLGKYIAGRV